MQCVLDGLCPKTLSWRNVTKGGGEFIFRKTKMKKQTTKVDASGPLPLPLCSFAALHAKFPHLKRGFEQKMQTLSLGLGLLPS